MIKLVLSLRSIIRELPIPSVELNFSIGGEPSRRMPHNQSTRELTQVLIGAVDKNFNKFSTKLSTIHGLNTTAAIAVSKMIDREGQ